MVAFRSELSLRGFRSESIFRSTQEAFLRAHCSAITGNVIEIGGEERYDHRNLCPKAASFRVTNVGRGIDDYLDVTNMDLPDASQEVFLCISVLEHVDDFAGACREISRTLQAGGLLVMTMPFLFPIHDTHDCWRVSRDGFAPLLGEDMEIVAFEHLGGRVSTIAALLQRPMGVWNRRYLPLKLFGMLFVALFGRFDQPDDSPLGFGVVARRRAQ